MRYNRGYRNRRILMKVGMFGRKDFAHRTRHANPCFQANQIRLAIVFDDRQDYSNFSY